MGELKPDPCPFCGKSYFVTGRGSEKRAKVLCTACEATGPVGHDGEASAITAWNTRPRTEGRGERQPVAWAYEYTNHLKGDRAPGGWLRAVAFEAPTRARVNAGFARNVQPLYASPIREPEISRTALIETMRQHIKADAVGLAPAVIAHYLVGFEEAADAILNLAPVAKGASQDAELSDEFDRPGRLSDATRHSAEGAADPALSGTRGVVTPVGGRGEEGSARADLSPASRSQDQHSDGGRG